MHDTVSVGIVGAGIWGTNHALALTTHPRARVRMICDSGRGAGAARG